jgi:hypothetical protein
MLLPLFTLSGRAIIGDNQKDYQHADGRYCIHWPFPLSGKPAGAHKFIAYTLMTVLFRSFPTAGNTRAVIPHREPITALFFCNDRIGIIHYFTR